MARMNFTAHVATATATALAAAAFIAMMTTSSCDGCSDPPAGPPEPDCVLDGDCGLGEQCIDGFCEATAVPDGGPVEDDAGPGDVDAGPDTDAGTAIGVLTFVPADPVEFGAEQLGVAVERSVTLKNTGTAPLTILQIVIDDDEAGTFSSFPTGVQEIVLEPDDETGVLLTHVPNDGVPDAAELKVLHDGEGGIASLELFAEFKGTPLASVTTNAGALVPDVTAVDVGLVPEGAAQSIDLLVRNRGASDSILTVRSVVVTPPTGAFSVTHPDLGSADALLGSFGAFCPTGDVATCPDSPTGPAVSCVESICRRKDGAPLDTFVARVTFSPTAAGPQQATITIGYEGGGSGLLQHDVVVTGLGTSGALLLTPGTVTFDNAFVGRPSSQVVTIANVGNANLTLDGVNLDNGAAGWTLADGPALPFVLVPDGETQVTVRITPPSVGSFDDTLRVTANGGADEVTASLSAQAREAPSVVVADTLPFGDVVVGAARTLPLSVENEGPGVLAITGMSISGDDSDRFSLSAPVFPASVDALDELVVDITYTPSGAPDGSVDSAVLRIDTDDPDVPFAEVDLSGRAIDPVIVVVNSSVNFGSIDVGTSASDQIEVRNNGFGPLIITAIDVAPGADFTASAAGGLPRTLNVGGPSLFIDVTFTATNPGASGATLTITSNGRGGNTATLFGAGGTCDPIFGADFVQNGADCTYTCATNFHDLDGDLNTPGTNGCEYGCTFQGFVDLPEADAPFTDQNCDGIDGTPGDAVFVSPAGSDANAGTIDAPLRNIDTAIARASLGGLDVYVAGGSYTLGSTLVLADGVSVFGGYALDFERNDIEVAVVQVASTVGARATNITSPTILDRLEISASDATLAGTSSFGLFATSSTNLALRSVTLRAGRGANGTAGTSTGGRAADGASGQRGQPGCEDSGGLCDNCSRPQGGAGGTSTCGRTGGRGGNAERGEGDPPGFDGDDGVGGTPGGVGVPGGLGNTLVFFDSEIGDNGSSGGAGANGAAGAAGFSSAGYVPTNGANGVNGTPGNAGGGGGGGGGGGNNCDSYGGGGGGGGAGGCGGERGTGGSSAGGSFALFAFASNVTVTDSTLITGVGGTGGAGGTGQDGGFGGSPGRRGTTDAGNDYGGSGEQDDGSNGARGGFGGAGGRGGHGGGGAGGPSVGIVAAGGSSVTQSTNTFALGAAGNGGPSSGNAGPTGTRVNVLTP